MVDKRIQGELSDLSDNPIFGIKIPFAHPRKWTIVMLDPETTNTFLLTCLFPDNYPLEPPEIKFATNINHPSVTQSGIICSDIFVKDWSPKMILETPC